MNAKLNGAMAHLLRERRTAALGTLRTGAPFVSMVPYAIAADGSGFVVHVSKLAAHTKDMLADARVSLLVADAQSRGEVSREVEPLACAQNLFALYFMALMMWLSGHATLESALVPVLRDAIALQIRGFRP